MTTAGPDGEETGTANTRVTSSMPGIRRSKRVGLVIWRMVPAGNNGVPLMIELERTISPDVFAICAKASSRSMSVPSTFASSRPFCSTSATTTCALDRRPASTWSRSAAPMRE